MFTCVVILSEELSPEYCYTGAPDYCNNGLTMTGLVCSLEIKRSPDHAVIWPSPWSKHYRSVETIHSCHSPQQIGFLLKIGIITIFANRNEEYLIQYTLVFYCLGRLSPTTSWSINNNNCIHDLSARNPVCIVPLCTFALYVSASLLIIIYSWIIVVCC